MVQDRARLVFRSPNASWCTPPHFIAIGNSLSEGTKHRCMTASPKTIMTKPQHHPILTTTIPDTAHAADVLESNFSGILMEFFAKHAQYPFDLLRGQSEDESEYLVTKMRDNALSGNALDLYSRACTEYTATGSNAPYIFEHAYAELPFVVGRQVEEVVEQETKPVPIGYRWA
jgi:hypothetical protein